MRAAWAAEGHKWRSMICEIWILQVEKYEIVQGRIMKFCLFIKKYEIVKRKSCVLLSSSGGASCIELHWTRLARKLYFTPTRLTCKILLCSALDWGVFERGGSLLREKWVGGRWNLSGPNFWSTLTVANMIWGGEFWWFYRLCSNPTIHQFGNSLKVVICLTAVERSLVKNWERIWDEFIIYANFCLLTKQKMSLRRLVWNFDASLGALIDIEPKWTPETGDIMSFEQNL